MPLENISKLIVTESDIRYVLETETDFIKDYLEDTKDPSLPAVLKVMDTSNQIQVFPLDEKQNLNNPLIRRQLLGAMGINFRTRCKMNILPAIAILSYRAWIKTYKSEKEFNPLLKPSDYVDAIDSIVIQVLTTNVRVKNKPTARTGMTALEVVQKEPYLKVKDLMEPLIEKVDSWEKANMLSDFYAGWFKQGSVENN